MTVGELTLERGREGGRERGRGGGRDRGRGGGRDRGREGGREEEERKRGGGRMKGENRERKERAYLSFILCIPDTHDIYHFVIVSHTHYPHPPHKSLRPSMCTCPAHA